MTLKRIAGLLILLALLPSPSGAAEIEKEVYKGFTLLILPAEHGVDYGVTLVEPDRAAANLKAALDLVLDRSPFNARQLNALKQNGNVYLIYDPGFPPERLHQGNFGRFLTALPAALGTPRAGGRKDYVMLVGRHGIKWPAREAAGILVHELAGHGTQHRQGRLAELSEADRECEARLYHEQSHQDFAVDKHSSWMTGFRRELEFKYCAGFKRWMKAERSGKMAMWETLNPDLPGLLKLFEGYARALGD